MMLLFGARRRPSWQNQPRGRGPGSTARPSQPRRSTPALITTTLLALLSSHAMSLVQQSPRKRPGFSDFLSSRVLSERSVAVVSRTALGCSAKARPRGRPSADSDTPDAANEDTSLEIDVHSVSEAEALLACRAYLQRRNRLGEWDDWETRKEQRAAATQRGRALDLSLVRDADIAFHPPGVLQENSDNVAENNYSAPWDSGPSQSRIRRSEAARRRWSDPEYRARWYAQRWKGRTGQQNMKEKVLEERIRAIKPEQFLAHPLVAAMTEEEIAEAIRTYVASRKKISSTRKKLAQARKNKTPSPKLPVSNDDTRDKLELFFNPELKAQQRKERAELAKMRYQSRLLNQQRSLSDVAEHETKTERRNVIDPSSSLRQDAATRVNAALDAGQLPTVQDVELLLQTASSGDRRALLRRIVRDGWGLRGRCIPIDVTDVSETTECVALSKAPNRQLEEFVLYRLRHPSP